MQRLNKLESTHLQLCPICSFENISGVSEVKVSKSLKENFEGLYLLSFHKN